VSIRVLVVDDDESHRVALVAAVESGVCLAFGAIGQRCDARCGACYSVRDVATAADAIREVEAWRPHLVISDQMLGTVATGSDVHRACVESGIDCMRVSGVIRCDSAGMLSKALDCRDVRLAVAQWVEGWLPHVLLIEDDPNHAAIERRAIADVLGVPVRVTRAATWQDAPRDLRGFRLVVVDTILPGSSIPGMDIASIVAESGVPVVMVSGAIPARLIHPGGGVPVVPKMLPEMRAAFALALGLGLRLDAGGV
jgi:CheY-like chemotaxis protein